MAVSGAAEHRLWPCFQSRISLLGQSLPFPGPWIKRQGNADQELHIDMGLSLGTWKDQGWLSPLQHLHVHRINRTSIPDVQEKYQGI
jgi:hypothetical protein